MKILDNLARRLTKTAAVTVKTEVKKSAVDLIPLVVGLASTIFGFFVLKDAVDDEPKALKPAVTNTSITTNNYFFRDMDESMIKKILEERK